MGKDQPEARQAIRSGQGSHGTGRLTWGGTVEERRRLYQRQSTGLELKEKPPSKEKVMLNISEGAFSALHLGLYTEWMNHKTQRRICWIKKPLQKSFLLSLKSQELPSDSWLILFWSFWIALLTSSLCNARRNRINILLTPSHAQHSPRWRRADKLINIFCLHFSWFCLF